MSREIEDMLERYAKKSKNIEYSTKVYGEKENEIKPEIRPIDFRTEDSDRPTLFLILKYKTLQGTPLEVIIAKLGNINDRVRRTTEIIKLIEEQLRDNAKGEEGYKYYEKLQEYLKTEGMSLGKSLDFTLEGINILSTKSKEELPIKRTHRINSNGKVEKLFSDQEISKMRKDNIPEIVKYTVWREGKEATLKSFITEDERQAFLRGEEIAQIMQSIEIADEDTDQTLENKNRRKMVANYLLDIYDGQNNKQEDDNQIKQLKELLEKRKNMTSDTQEKMLVEGYLERINSKIANNNQRKSEEQGLLKKYLAIKEKGLAIDVNIALENLEKNIYNKIEGGKEGNISPEDNEQLQKLQNGQHFFNFTKQGFDKTARVFAMKTGNLNLEFLRKLIEENDGQDQELLQYIEFKQKMLEEVKTEDIQNKENKYPIVRELYEFLLNSSVRKNTKEDDETLFSELFKKSKEKLLTSNVNEINLYNKAAKKYGAYICPTIRIEKGNAIIVDNNKLVKQEELALAQAHKDVDKILKEVEYPTSPEDH